jgi:hypothetical protein
MHWEVAVVVFIGGLGGGLLPLPPLVRALVAGVFMVATLVVYNRLRGRPAWPYRRGTQVE